MLKSKVKLLIAFLCGITLASFFIYAPSTLFQGSFRRQMDPPKIEVQFPNEDLPSISIEDLNQECTIDHCDLLNEILKIRQMLNNYFTSNSSSWTEYTTNDSFWTEFTGTFTNFTSEWTNFTSEWTNFTSNWTIFTNQWTNFTTGYSMFTQTIQDELDEIKDILNRILDRLDDLENNS